MSIYDRLQQILGIIQSKSFLEGRGLGNDLGFYIFDYDPEDELAVRDHIAYLKKRLNTRTTPKMVIEFDLYAILIDFLESEELVEEIVRLEEEKGPEYILEAIRDVASPDFYVDYIAARGEDYQIVFLTGIGKVWPIIRSHNILNNLHHVLENKPVIMFFPGVYDGTGLRLFGRIKDDNYYRAFQLVAK
ncbi:MAG: DUF1788 domain-containing protein [Firmicutes bacterium]|nr:DUF1788 domain-containing protein [Bacillota bacterium]